MRPRLQSHSWTKVRSTLPPSLQLQHFRHFSESQLFLVPDNTQLYLINCKCIRGIHRVSTISRKCSHRNRGCSDRRCIAHFSQLWHVNWSFVSRSLKLTHQTLSKSCVAHFKRISFLVIAKRHWRHSVPVPDCHSFVFHAASHFTAANVSENHQIDFCRSSK